MPNRFVQYATFAQGELEKTLTTLDPEGKHQDTIASVRQENGNGSTRPRLLKKHSCTVFYPDGTEGICQYTREGPRAHLFDFQHTNDKGTVPLPRQYVQPALANTADAIAAKAQEIASIAFAAAIQKERQDYFCRASEPSDGSRKPNPEKYQMSAKRAKEIAGKYALCIRLGESDHLVPDSPLFDSIEEASAAWSERSNPTLVVACCNRLDRCWEQPRFRLIPQRMADAKPDSA